MFNQTLTLHQCQQPSDRLRFYHLVVRIQTCADGEGIQPGVRGERFEDALDVPTAKPIPREKKKSSEGENKKHDGHVTPPLCDVKGPYCKHRMLPWFAKCVKLRRSDESRIIPSYDVMNKNKLWQYVVFESPTRSESQLSPQGCILM